MFSMDTSKQEVFYYHSQPVIQRLSFNFKAIGQQVLNSSNYFCLTVVSSKTVLRINIFCEERLHAHKTWDQNTNSCEAKHWAYKTHATEITSKGSVISTTAARIGSGDLNTWSKFSEVKASNALSGVCALCNCCYI